MMTYQEALDSIVKNPAVLSVPCKEVTDETFLEATKIARRLIEIANVLDSNPMRKCAGLAANQIGSDLRVFVIKMGKGFVGFINPQMVPVGKPHRIGSIEGCFSFPEAYRSRQLRYPKILARCNAPQFVGRARLEGTEARAFQHELDHLNGRHI